MGRTGVVEHLMVAFDAFREDEEVMSNMAKVKKVTEGKRKNA